MAGLPLRGGNTKIDLQKSFDHLYNDRKQQTEEDHRGKGKIEPEIFFFQPDIAWQPADPVQLIPKEINNDTYDVQAPTQPG